MCLPKRPLKWDTKTAALLSEEDTTREIEIDATEVTEGKSGEKVDRERGRETGTERIDLLPNGWSNGTGLYGLSMISDNTIISNFDQLNRERERPRHRSKSRSRSPHRSAHKHRHHSHSRSRSNSRSKSRKGHEHKQHSKGDRRESKTENDLNNESHRRNSKDEAYRRNDRGNGDQSSRERKDSEQSPASNERTNGDKPYSGDESFDGEGNDGNDGSQTWYQSWLVASLLSDSYPLIINQLILFIIYAPTFRFYYNFEVSPIYSKFIWILNLSFALKQTFV